MKLLVQQGKRPIIYTYHWFWEHYFGGWNPGIPLWTADYENPME